MTKKAKRKAEKPINVFDGLIHNKDGSIEFGTNEDHPNVIDDVHPNGGLVSQLDSYMYNPNLEKKFPVKLH